MPRKSQSAGQLIRPGAAALVGAGLALALRSRWRRSQAAGVRGQVVLITGSSRGLGLALAREYARCGSRLVLCARDADELERARAEIAALGAEVLAVQCDVADRRQIEHLVQSATVHFGRIDVLVANAGIISVGPIAEQRVEDFERAMAVMFWGAVYSVYAVLPPMRRRGTGRIAIVSSIGGKVSVPHLTPYSAAKSAVIGFAEGLRAELVRDGISVTTVVPGLLRTGSHLNAEFKGQHRAEFTWFSLGATLPFTSESAEDAARDIVSAVQRGQAEVILGWQAALLARMHGVAPGLTTDLMGLVNRFLPSSDDPSSDDNGARAVPGWASESALTASPLEAAGRQAARDLNQT